MPAMSCNLRGFAVQPAVTSEHQRLGVVAFDPLQADRLAACQRCGLRSRARIAREVACGSAIATTSPARPRARSSASAPSISSRQEPTSLLTTGGAGSPGFEDHQRLRFADRGEDHRRVAAELADPTETEVPPSPAGRGCHQAAVFAGIVRIFLHRRSSPPPLSPPWGKSSSLIPLPPPPAPPPFTPPRPCLPSFRGGRLSGAR